jgi:enoyl-CoA hydratase/carnithine racemase
LLPKLIGEVKAREYLLIDKNMTGYEAIGLGLAVAVADNPMAEATALAERLEISRDGSGRRIP